MSQSQAPENSYDDPFGLDFVVCVVSPSMTPVPTEPRLLLCPICNRPFNPSKNRKYKSRRNLKNVHMSPRMHPCKREWDSLPNGRVIDNKECRERTRKSKGLPARKYHLRRRVEEAALVLNMLYQAALVLSMLYQAV